MMTVSGDTSEPVKGTGTDMTRKSIQETERRNYTRYTLWECVSALLLTDRRDALAVLLERSGRTIVGIFIHSHDPSTDGSGE